MTGQLSNTQQGNNTEPTWLPGPLKGLHAVPSKSQAATTLIPTPACRISGTKICTSVLSLVKQSKRLTQST